MTVDFKTLPSRAKRQAMAEAMDALTHRDGTGYFPEKLSLGAWAVLVALGFV